jgi:CheY-like chemotaxis protein
MPLMTGDRAVAEILAERPQLPVLIMSGLMDQDAVAAALRNVGEPRVALLRKPFTTQELLGAMERVLAPAPSPP